MKLSGRSALALVAGAFMFLASSRDALSETVVKVSLWDKGEASMDAMDTS